MASIATGPTFSPVPTLVSGTPTPASAWAQLAHRVAGQPRMCVSRNGGRSYPVRGDRQLGATPPNQPAAVFVYGPDGCASTLILDLDSPDKRAINGHSPAVEADLKRLRRALDVAGVTYVLDGSPNGGRHVYIPLAERLGRSILGEIVKNVATHFRTIDPTPMLNVARGLIRPPGARHRSGGFQQLIGTTVAEAVAAYEHPNSIATLISWAEQYEPEATVAGLRSDAPQRAPLLDRPNAAGHADALEQLPPLPGLEAGITGRWHDVAVTGRYEKHGYATGSEARQAVMWAAAAAGLNLAGVVARIEDGTWRGLRSLYTKYGPAVRRGEIAADWRKAVAHEQRRRQTRSSVHASTTSVHKTRAPAPDRLFLRSWLRVAEARHRDSPLAVRAVLQALAGCAMRKGSVALDFGNRNISLHSSLDHSTVGSVLNQLCAEQNPLVKRTRDAFGPLAHEYTLVMPDQVEHLERQPYLRGRIDGILPVFRQLGLAAAFAYDALRRTSLPMTVRGTAAAAHLSTGAAQDALLTLGAHGLASKTPAGWVIGPADPVRVAEQVGALDEIADLVRRFRKERDAWWSRIGYSPVPSNPPEPSGWDVPVANTGPRRRRAGSPGAPVYVPPPPDPLEHATTDPFVVDDSEDLARAVDLARVLLGAVVVQA